MLEIKGDIDNYLDGDYFKEIEKNYDIEIPSYKGMLIRFDGKNFSNFTKGFKKPFDKLMIDAIIETTYQLIEKTSAKTAFCCSDEITLVLPPLCTEDEYNDKSNANIPLHPFRGRVVKLSSVYGSYCSVFFNNSLKKFIKELKNREDYLDNFLDICEKGIQVFDARITPYNTINEVFHNLSWRSLLDCRRNSISQYGQHYLEKKTVFGKKSNEIIDLLKIEGYDWNKFPLEFRYGVVVKKILVDKETTIKGKKIIYNRGEPQARVFTEQQFRDIDKNIFHEKYWTTNFGFVREF